MSAKATLEGLYFHAYNGGRFIRGGDMVEVNVGDQLWVVIKEDEEGYDALNQTRVLENPGPAVSVVVAPATVLEGGKTAELFNGATFDLLPGRTFRTIEEAEEAGEALAKETP